LLLAASPLAVGLVLACGPKARPAAAPAMPPEVMQDVVGPVSPPPGFDFDARGSAQLAVAAATTPAGRVVAVATPVEAPAVQVHDSKAGPTVFPLEDVRIAARNLDTKDGWAFHDLARGTGDISPTVATLDAWMFHERVLPSARPGELLLQELPNGGVRALTTGLGLGPEAKEALPDALAACGGSAEVTTRVSGTATLLDVKQGAKSTTKAAIVGTVSGDSPVAARVAVRATACCDGQLAWVEVHPPQGVNLAKLDTTPNHPMAVGVQGMTAGTIEDDVLPGLVGAEDVHVEIARFGLACIGARPVVAVVLNNAKHRNELWLSVPRLPKSAADAGTAADAGDAPEEDEVALADTAAGADAGATAGDGGTQLPGPRAMCEVKDAGARRK